MSSKKQATLFQSWGSKQQNKPVKTGTCHNGSSSAVVNLYEEDEDLLIARAMEESLRDLEQKKGQNGGASSTPLGEPCVKDAFSDDEGDVYENIPLGDVPESTAIEDLPGFDKNAGGLWIYPTNYPVRDYQFSIVDASLYKNTMVVLPTGLGKTFIAAVVMYNFYRWYPQGKVVFMAPTKPLVAQQIEACYNIMGIPQDDTAEMTGAMNPAERKRSWDRKRVFFLTPQVLTNDLNRSACPAEAVKCLVVDEAHKATGNHAYCQVVKELIKYNQQFRILALSATPGSDIKAVQQVLSNLLISHIELKSEESPDIRKYSHERRVDKVVVPLGQELVGISNKYLQIMTVVVNRLKRVGVLYNRDTKSFSKFLILKARESFRHDPPPNMQRSQFGSVEGDFALAMSLYHGFDLLQQHGLRSLYNYLDSILSGDKASGRTKNELMKNADFREIIDTLTAKFQPIKSAHPDACTPSQFSPMRASQMAKPFAVGHPKMDKLKDIVLEHFNKYKDDGLETRIMIFSQFRDSVNEITEILNRHRPLVKVMSFIGQSVGKSSKGFSQKDQLRVMAQFRDGGYNTLVSTCVGEEGLDIGDVDLIICFDAHKSPIRLVQRMGRTGRKREGRIVMLVTEGKEEQIYNQSQYSKRSIHKAIQNGARSLHFYPNNPRMVPQGLNPNVHKMHITVHTKFNAKAAKGKAASNTAPQKTRITGMLQTKGARSKSRNVDKKDGFLTPQELEYWNEKYYVDEKNIPTLPEPEYLFLAKKDKSQSLARNTPAPDNHHTLSLGKWLPWQNRLQDTHLSGHSLRSEHLVQLTEFMDIQNTVESGGDHYGTEMQMYLHDEDIIRPDQKRDRGILKYCTEATDKGRNTVAGVNKKPRRNTVLPEWSSGEEEICSEDELPGLQEVLTRKTGKQRKKPGTTSKITSPTNQSNDQYVLCDTTTSPPETTSRKLRKPCFQNDSKKANKDISLIQIIEDKDSQDFETGDLGDFSPPANNKSRSPGNSELKTNSDSIQPKSATLGVFDLGEDNFDMDVNDVMPELPSLANIEEQEPMDCFEEKPVDNKLDKVAKENYNNRSNNCNSENVEPGSCGFVVNDQEEKRLSQLLPDFTGRARDGRIEDKISTIDTLGGVIRTPPPLEEVDLIMGELDKQGCLSPVDVLDLIDKWETERPIGITGKMSSHRKDEEKVLGNTTTDTGSQTKTRKSSEGQKRSTEKVKVSVTTSSISVCPVEEESRMDKVTREIKGAGYFDNFDENKDNVVEGDKGTNRILQKSTTGSDSLDQVLTNGDMQTEISGDGYKPAVSPMKSQVLRKPLFKKSPSTISSCIAEKNTETKEGNLNSTSVDTSLLRGFDVHDFSLPLTDEKNNAIPPFESYGRVTPSVKNKRTSSHEKREAFLDFVKASDLVETPNGKRNEKASCSSDDYSPTFDDAPPGRSSLATSTPAIVKPVDLLSKTNDKLEDSFFNQADDAIFGELKTPLSSMQAETKVIFEGSKGQLKSSGREKGLKALTNQSLNSTQITFTQALAFADESLNTSHSFTGSSRSNLENSLLSSKHTSKNTSNRDTGEQVSQSASSASNNSNRSLRNLHCAQNKSLEKDKTPLERSLNSFNSEKSGSEKAKFETEEDFGPDFDLGFDLDDDMEDVVPPSPLRSTQPFSQTAGLSKTGATTLGCVSTIDTESLSTHGTSPALIGGLGVKFSQKLPEASRERKNEEKKCESNDCSGENDDLFDGESNEEFSEFIEKSEELHENRIKSNSSEENTSISILPQLPKQPVSQVIKNKLVESQTNNNTSGTDKRKFNLFRMSNRKSPQLASTKDNKLVLDSKGQRSRSPKQSNEDVIVLSHSDSEDSDSLLLVPKPKNTSRLKKKEFKNSIARESVQTASTPVARIIPQCNKQANVSIYGTEGVKFEDLETLEMTAGDFEDSLFCMGLDEEGEESGELRPTETGLRPTETELRPTETELRPTETELRPTKTELRPTETALRPTETELRHTETGLRPTKTELRCHEMERTGGRASVGRFDEITDGIYGEEDLDESLVQVKRKRKAVALIASPDTPVCDRQGQVLDDSEFKTPLKPPPRSKRTRQVLSSDDEDNVEVTMETKRRKTLSFHAEVSDDDFEDYGPPVSAVSRSTRDERKTRKEHRKKKKQGCGFIEEEVDLSGDSDQSTDDEDGSDLDQLDDSFVNDATQLTQGVADRDMHAVYMRSINSPQDTTLRMPERYRLKHNPNLNVFSQLPTHEEESCYMEDSFVVGSDHEYGESEFVADQTIMEAAILPTSRRRCTRNAYRNNVMLAKMKDKKLMKDGSRKRIKRIQHSSSSEDEGERNVTVSKKCTKSRISSSSSDSPVPLIHHKSPELNPAGRRPNPRTPTCTVVRPPCEGSPALSGFTQIPSLQTRCRQRMQNNNSSHMKTASDSRINNSTKSMHQRDDKNKISDQNLDIERNKRTKEKLKEQTAADFDLSFDLGLDDLVEDDNTEDCGNKVENNHQGASCTSISSRSKPSSHIQASIHSHPKVSSSSNIRSASHSVVSHTITRSHIQSTDKENSSLSTTETASSPVGSSILSSQTSSVGSSPSKQLLSKEERLRLSRLKQEEFKKKYASKMDKSHVSNNNVTILDNTLPSEPRKFGMYSSPAPSNMLSDITKSESSKGQGLVVFVDSREINAAQDVISVLRAKHHYHTDINQLQGCDYIISHRMAVERKVVSDFTNGANKAKLVDRLKQMRDLFEKCVLLVEKDRLKAGEREPANKTILKSKYVESMLSSLCQMQIKVYFSESQENTADVLSQLIDIEKRKGFGIIQRKALIHPQTQVLKFYLSIPKVSHITALNFLYSCRTLKDFINSPVGSLEKKGQISREKASEIHRYVQHQFNPQMLVIKR